MGQNRSTILGWGRSGQHTAAPALDEQLRKSLVPCSPTERRPQSFLVSSLGPLCAHPLVFLTPSFHLRPDSVSLGPISWPESKCQRQGSVAATASLAGPAVVAVQAEEEQPPV